MLRRICHLDIDSPEWKAIMEWARAVPGQSCVYVVEVGKDGGLETLGFVEDAKPMERAEEHADKVVFTVPRIPETKEK